MFNISIVLYKHSYESVRPLIEKSSAIALVNKIFIIDNSPAQLQYSNLPEKTVYNFIGRNVGYGAGHNIAIRESMAANIPYHLVLNPDIDFDGAIFENIVRYMDQNDGVAHLMPKVYYPDGSLQYLCKLIPSPADLFFKRFLPGNQEKRLHKFQLRFTGYDKIMNVPYLSGCFMFLRTASLREVGLFDEKFFMYPEDIDLTRRLHEKYRTVFFPEVSIIHQHEAGSYKSKKMLWIHITNMIKYFNKWGWVFDNKRKLVNKRILTELKYHE